jgi:hypothetical protein
MDYQKLFNYMKNEHDITLLETDMIEIERIVLESRKTIKAKAYYQYETYTSIEVVNADLPDKFRLKDIEILLP